MPTERFAVEAIVQGLGTFLNSIQAINNSVANMGTAVTVTNGKLSILGATLDKHLNRWRDLNGQFVSTATVAGRIQNAMAGVGIAAQQGLTGILQLGIGMTKLASASLGADAELQRKPRDMGNVSTATVALGKTVSDASQNVINFGGVFGALKGVFDAIMRSISSLGAIAGSVFSWFGETLSRIFQTGLGFAFGQMIVWLQQEIRGLAGELVRATADFQQLEIRFRTLAARDIAKEQGITISEAYSLATAKARGYLEWVRKIAIETPFNAEDVARTVAMANAFGMNTEAARELTGSVLDFAAAFGLTNDHIYRIMYNFGQMVQQGKTTGREMRDLAVSFVPIHEILGEIAKDMKITSAQAEEMALKGIIPVSTVLKKFSDDVKNNYAGAAKAMSMTLTYSWENLKDWARMTASMDVFGPLAKTIALGFTNLLEVVRGDDIRNALRVIGEVLNYSVLNIANVIGGQLFPAIGKLGQAFGITGGEANSFAQTLANIGAGAVWAVDKITGVIKQITTWIGTNFTQLQNNGFTWGHNLIMQFASGMATAIKAIALVVGQIYSFLASMFRTHSPPKIAPNIDKYGEGLMKEYYKGMVRSINNRDVTDALDRQLAKTLGAGSGSSSAKKTAQAAGKKTAEDYAAQARADIQPLIDQFGGGAMGKLTGGFGKPEFNFFTSISESAAGFIRSLQGIGIPPEGVIPKILGTRTAIAEGITAIRSGMSSVSDVVAKVTKAMGEVPAGFATYITAMFQVEQAQKELNDITDKYDKQLKDLNDQLKQVTDEYNNQQRIEEIDKALGSGLLTTKEKERLLNEKKAIQLREQIAATEKARDADVTAAKDKVDTAQAQLDAAKALIDVQVENNNLIKEQMNLLEGLYQKANQAGGGAKSLSDALDSLANLSGGTGVEVNLPDITSLVDGIMRKAELNFLAWKESMKTSIAQAFGYDSWDALAADFNTKLIRPIEQFFTNFSTWWNENAAPMFTDLGKLMGGTFDTLMVAIGNLGIVLEGLGINGGDAMTLLLGVLLGLVAGPIIAGIIILGSVINGVAYGIQAVKNTIEQFQPAFQQLIKWWNGAIRDWNNATTVLGKVGAAFEIVGAAILMLVGGALLVLTEAFAAVLAFAKGFVEGVIAFFVMLYNKLVGQSIIPDMMLDIYNAITGKFNEIITFIATWVTDRLKQFEQMGKDLYTAAKGAFDQVVSAVKDAIGGVAKWIGDRIQEWINLLKNIKWPKITLPGLGGSGNNNNNGGNNGGGCFLPETNVLTPDGWRKMGELQSGDKVMVMSRLGPTPASMYGKYSVTRDDLVIVTVSNGRSFTCSPNHPIKLATGQFCPAAYLNPDEALYGWTGGEKVVSVQPFEGEREVFNFTTDHPEHTYIVEGVVVHNTKQTGKAFGGPLSAGQWAMVGENGPELVRFPKAGYVFNTNKTRDILTGLDMIATVVGSIFNANRRVSAMPRYGSVNNSRTINISVDANYAQTQSPASIYYDLTAALVAAKL